MVVDPPEAATVPEGGALKMDCCSSVTSTCVPGGRYVPSNFANVFDFDFAYSILCGQQRDV